MDETITIKNRATGETQDISKKDWGSKKATHTIVKAKKIKITNTADWIRSKLKSSSISGATKEKNDIINEP